DLLVAWGSPSAASATGLARPRVNARPWTRKFPSQPSIEANAQNAARLLLANSGWWDELAMPDHEVLCGLEGGCGELFRWLDGQAHEHGPQPLAALMIAAEGQSFEPIAKRLIELETMQPHGRMVEDTTPSLRELRRLVSAVRLDVLELQLKQVQALPASDPSRAPRELELIRDQFELKKQHLSLLKTPEKDIM